VGDEEGGDKEGSGGSGPRGGGKKREGGRRGGRPGRPWGDRGKSKEINSEVMHPGVWPSPVRSRVHAWTVSNASYHQPATLSSWWFFHDF